MNYIEILSGQRTSLREIRAAHPSMSIPDGADLTDLGYALIVQTPMPELQPGESAVPGPVENVGGQWRETWTVLPPPAPDTRTTKLAFRNRFTQAEKVAMEIAGLDNPAAPMAERAQSAALRANVADLAAATFIDLQRPDTRAGVQMLEAAGLLAPGRALAILDAPIRAEERPL